MIFRGVELSHLEITFLFSAGEILDSPKYALDPALLEQLVDHLRTLVRIAVDTEIGQAQPAQSPNVLTRIVRLFHKMATHKSSVVRDGVSVPNELFSLIEYSSNAQKEIDAIGFLASMANPLDTLQTMKRWTSNLQPDRKVVLSTLHTVLRKASVAGVGMGLSGSLLRIKQARGNREGDATPVGGDDLAPYPRQSIWRMMYNGEANIDK